MNEHYPDCPIVKPTLYFRLGFWDFSRQQREYWCRCFGEDLDAHDAHDCYAHQAYCDEGTVCDVCGAYLHSWHWLERKGL
jgi:hypothetical protein